MKNQTIAAGLLLIAAGAGALSAHNFRAGKLVINHPWTRETAVGQADGGGFLSVTNAGKTGDMLLSVSSPAAREVQLHRMSMEGGVMRMRQLDGGIAIPAGQTVALKPGSYHLMFIGLKQQMKKGSFVPATLRFRNAGKVDVRFAVQPVTSTGPQEAGHGGH